jgi:TP901 family phage tail tape measure protein
MADLETSILIKILDAFTAPLRKLDEGLEDVEERAKKVEKRLKLAADLNQAAEGAGRFARMLAGPIEASVSEFARFEAAMSRVSALSGEAKGSPLFNAMKKQAEELGAATQYSAEEVAKLMQEYSQAGFTPEQILGMSAQTLSAATASGLDLARTAEIVGGTMRSMGIDVAETGRTIDVLTKAASESNSNMTDMAEAMSYAGPVARSAGMSLEQTAGMIAALSNEMVKGSRAGTGLASLINQIVGIKQGDAQAKAFSKIGFSYERVVELQKLVAGGQLQQALATIGQAVDKLPNDRRMRALENIFGKDLATSTNILMNASVNGSVTGLTAITASLNQLNDDTNKMAKTMQDNLLGSFERAQGAIDGLKTATGEALAPTAKAAAEALEGMAGEATEFVKQYPAFARGTGTLIAGLSGLAFTMQGGLLAASAYQSAMAGLTKAFGGMSQSLGGRLGLLGLAATAGLLVGTWANETLELDNAIAKLAGRARGGKEGEGGKGANKDVQTTQGGWEVNMRTGEVKTMGTGEGPAIVRRARARGATTQAELSALIGQELTGKANRPLAERAQEAGSLEAANLLLRPGLDARTPGRPSVLLPQTPAEGAAAAATKEQTAALLETLRKQEANTAKMAEQMARLSYLTPGGMGPLVSR